MAIRTKKTELPGIRFPVVEAARPTVAGFVPVFGRPINVIDVECANIGKAALNTRATKTLNQSQLPPPVGRVLVDDSPMLVPIVLLAVARAKTRVAFFAARFTSAVLSPASCKIAGLPAILAVTVLDTVGVHQGGRAAMLARDFDFGGSRLSHSQIIYEFDVDSTVTDELKRPRLDLGESPQKQIQEDMGI
jgi:hypothetical protein